MQASALSSCWCEIPWFPYAERDLSDLADDRARVLYKERSNWPQNHLGNMQKISILHI